MPPDDPLGRHGPSLENFLRKRPVIPEHRKQPCPYGKNLHVYMLMLSGEVLICNILEEKTYFLSLSGLFLATFFILVFRFQIKISDFD